MRREQLPRAARRRGRELADELRRSGVLTATGAAAAIEDLSER